MPGKKRFDKKHWAWISVLLLHTVALVAFIAWPFTLPEGESQRILSQAAPYDVIIIFNPGGWGNATLEQSKDFTPILLNIQATLRGLGYSSLLVVYNRTAAGFSGEVTGLKGLISDFRDTAQVQAKDISSLTKSYPEKHILLTGFSNGGGLTARTMDDLQGLPGVCSIVAGAAGWHKTEGSSTRLVLNNNGRDTLTAADPVSLLIGTLESPFRLLWAKLNGKPMPLGLSLQFPGHEYQWSSQEVGPPIVEFLARNFKK
jgi:pimeloyl-ACP methyl ester carboxylesterase